MISEDISNGEELVKVPVVNELSDERPTSFGVTRFSWCCISQNAFPAYRSRTQKKEKQGLVIKRFSRH